MEIHNHALHRGAAWNESGVTWYSIGRSKSRAGCARHVPAVPPRAPLGHGDNGLHNGNLDRVEVECVEEILEWGVISEYTVGCGKTTVEHTLVSGSTSRPVALVSSAETSGT